MSKVLELRVYPLGLFFLTAVAVVASRRLPGSRFETPFSDYAALLLLSIGALIALLALINFHQNATTVHPKQPEQATTLVTRGVFAFSRNPMYLGLVIMLIAEAVWMETYWGIAFAIGFGVYITRFQIIPEERHLREKFGEAFERYCAQTRRWI